MADWRQDVRADRKWNIRDLVLTTDRRTPENFGVAGVELEAVGSHPHSDVGDAHGYSIMQSCSIFRTAEPIDLRIIGVEMWMQIPVFHEPQQVGRVQ
jgi:hypothetical protein